MTFDTDERSVEDSQPREGYEFILPAATYRLASGVKDIVINGQTYRAGTIERNAIVPTSTSGSRSDLEVSLVITHAVPQRWLRGGLPPSGGITVNVYRKQLQSGEYQQAFTGRVVGMRCEGNLGVFGISQRYSEALVRRIPTVTVGKECAHVLFDDGCRLNRNAFKVATTILPPPFTSSPREMTVAAIGGHPDGWANFGELVHVASGERRTIASQVGTKLVLQLPITDAQVGDAVEVYAGCAHDIPACLGFDNVDNFGGFPHLPTKNPFIDNGYGIVEQE